MRVLITGITGFVGSHVADFLLTQPDVEIIGTKRWRSNTENIQHLAGRVRLVECDVRDQTSVRSTIEAVRPDRIVHLASQSFVPMSWSAPSETLTTNVLGQLHLFDAIRACGLSPRILIAGSSEEYGRVSENELPIRETNPLRPLSPYAVSKVTQDLLAYQYAQSYGLHIIRARAFNHTGPRRGEVFASSNFAKQLALIEAGLQEPVVQVGNLDAERDFTDVRDIVRGYWLALDHAEPSEVYNLCSGKAITIRELLERLIELSGKAVEIRVDPQRLRPSDVPRLRGDFSKFARRTGWQPEIPFSKTLDDLLHYWRAKIRSQSGEAAWMPDAPATSVGEPLEPV